MLTRDSIIFVHGLRGHPRETWTSRYKPENQNMVGASKRRQHLRSLFRSSSPHPESDNSSLQKGMATQQEQVFWPQDYLAEDIAQARVWTYGYNADVIGGLFRANGKDSVSQHGRNLAVRLEREVDNKVFIFHRRFRSPMFKISTRIRLYLWLIVWEAFWSKMYGHGNELPVDDSRC